MKKSDAFSRRNGMPFRLWNGRKPLNLRQRPPAYPNRRRQARIAVFEKRTKAIRGRTPSDCSLFQDGAERGRHANPGDPSRPKRRTMRVRFTQAVIPR